MLTHGTTWPGENGPGTRTCGKKKTFSGIVALRCVNRSQNNTYKDGTSSAFAGALSATPIFRWDVRRSFRLG